MVSEACSTRTHAMTPEPWYRQGWPWFLISIPLTSVLLGFLMLYLGLNTNNSLVVGDYYKQGKAINARIDRDRTASLLGLTASVRNSEEGLLLDLKHAQRAVPASLSDDAQRLRADFRFPQKLHLQFVHVTQASKDTDVLLEGIGGGRYLSTTATMPQQGRWRAHVEPVAAAELKEQQRDTTHSPGGDKRSGDPSALRSNDWRLVGESTSYLAGNSALISASEAKAVFPGHMLN